MGTASFDDYFNPRSIAIVGASDDPRRIGGRPLSHMINQRFDGAVYPVNAKRDKVQGLRAYPSLDAIDGELDFVLVAVPAEDVAPVLRQAAAKKAKTALIFSSGFAEVGGKGVAMQDEVARIARDTGLRVIGPNCLGLFNSATRFYPTFTSTIDRATPTPGGISIASQSGAYGSHIYMVSHMRGLGIGYWATTGNESDLHVAELIGMFAEREDVHTIVAYAESIKDGPLLVGALEKARANRIPVIFMKVGRSEVGAHAAGSHTASLAGEDAVYDAVFRQHGAYRARSTEETLDIAYACRPRIYPAGRRLGLVTISGGAGVLMSDAAHDCGLEVPPMPEDAQAEMKALLPFAAPRNPVDVTAQFFNDLTLVPRFTRMMLDRGNYDGLVGFWTSVAGSPVLGNPLLAHLKETMADYPNRLFLQCILASDEMRKSYEDAGFPCFEDPTRTIAAMAALMFFGVEFAKGAPEALPLPKPVALPSGPISERDAKAILAGSGLPMVEDCLVTSAEQAGEAAARAKSPVAMKVVSPDIPHKTEAGGVILGVKGVGDAERAYRAIMANAARHAPEARIEGVLISPMIDGGVECILGAKIDPVFGPVVMVGLGGIFTEVLKDVVFRRAPIGVSAAHEMIGELKGAAILKGARGKPGVNLDALAGAISKLSLFAAANADRLESVEMNPVRALPDGCVALDALIVTRRT
jgi:acyl-CoA synthetase (NDP forming)